MLPQSLSTISEFFRIKPLTSYLLYFPEKRPILTIIHAKKKMKVSKRKHDERVITEKGVYSYRVIHGPRDTSNIVTLYFYNEDYGIIVTIEITRDHRQKYDQLLKTYLDGDPQHTGDNTCWADVCNYRIMKEFVRAVYLSS